MCGQRANCLVRQPRRAIIFAVSSAAAFYRASGLVLWREADIGTTGVIHRAAGQLGQTDCHPENLLRTEWDRRTCAVGPEAEITMIRIDNVVQP